MARQMRDSGVEWIDEIPVDWKTKRNKQLFYEVNDRCEHNDGYTLLSVSEHYGIAPKSEKIKEGEFETRAESLDGYKICKRDDIVMNIMLAWKKSTGHSDYEGIVSPAYCVYRKKDEIYTKYYHYLFRTDIVANLFKKHSTGIIDSRLRLYPDKFLGIKMIVPPYKEQEKIAHFLDQQCTYIDAVIEKTKASIEEYKKLKQAIITWAVTKGIRGDRPMKDSGVEWIDEIPIGWNKTRLKALFDFGKGLPITKDNLEETGIAVISYGQIHAKYNTSVTLDERLFRYVNESYLETNEQSLVYEGDIIVADTSEDLGGCGNCVYVDKEMKLFAGYHTIILQSIKRKNNKYLAYLMLTDDWRSQLRCNASGVKLFSISKKMLSETTVVLPDEEEQIEIVEYLNKKCDEIVKVILKKEKVIRELEEYKKSLIYEYVTGKKEVPTA